MPVFSEFLKTPSSLPTRDNRKSWSNNSHFTSNDTNANKKKENDKLLKCRHINILAMVYMMVINPEAANFIYRTVISDLFYTEYITAA
ncbi:hypothetical protein MZT44_14405 [Escherichia coli]|uniref:hypothetical protein n=1 Tax=Escherichia coli TaxID=562 RepID=UPI003457BAE1